MAMYLFLVFERYMTKPLAGRAVVKSGNPVVVLMFARVPRGVNPMPLLDPVLRVVTLVRLAGGVFKLAKETLEFRGRMNPSL